MKKLRLILPLLAFICAIGMSFTTVTLDADPLNDYILQGGNWQAIPEIACNPQDEACLVRLQPDGPVHQVYDAPDPGTAKEGDGTVFDLF